jgi:hypothetical protein
LRYNRDIAGIDGFGVRAHYRQVDGLSNSSLEFFQKRYPHWRASRGFFTGVIALSIGPIKVEITMYFGAALYCDANCLGYFERQETQKFKVTSRWVKRADKADETFTGPQGAKQRPICHTT